MPTQHGFSLLISVECVRVKHYPLSALYAVRCLEGITFQTECLLMDQSQKHLRHSKIPDLFAAK